MAGNAVSGMETSASIFAFSGFLLLLWGAQQEGATLRQAFTAGISSTLVPMFRPEMAAAVLSIIGALVVFNPKAFRSTVVLAGTFVALGAAYFYARYSYYGLLLPLPFYIKHGGIGLFGIKDITSYLTYMGILIGAACIVPPLCFVLRKRATQSIAANFLLALFISVFIQLAYYATVRHIMGFGFRYFVPISAGLLVLAFMALGCIVALVPVRSWPVFKKIITLGIAILVSISAFRIADARHLFIDWYAETQISAEKVAKTMQKSANGQQFTIALNDCGVIPFYTGFKIIDLAGLNNKAIALGRTNSSVLKELEDKIPDMVLLVSSGESKSSVFGWEMLSSDDLVKLGYTLRGSIYIMRDYTYLVYSRDDDRVIEYIQKFVSSAPI